MGLSVTGWDFEWELVWVLEWEMGWVLDLFRHRQFQQQTWMRSF